MARNKTTPAPLRPVDVAALPCFLCGAPAYDAQACEDPEFVDSICEQEKFFAGIGGCGDHVCTDCSQELFQAIEGAPVERVLVRLPARTRKKGGSKTRGTPK